MRKLLLSTAAVGMITASGASAQVLVLIDSLADTVIDGTPNTAVFSGVADNIGDIDGSVSIAGIGAVAGSVSTDGSTSTTVALTGLTFGNTAQQSSTVGAGLAEIDIQSSLLGGGLVDCDVSATGDSAQGACNFGIGGASFESLVAATSDASINTTTQMDFGAVSTLAAGAVNDVNMNVSMTGASAVTTAAANTSDTASNATSDTTEAAALVGNTIAYNTGAINGSVDVGLALTSSSFESISTTAAGAINTGEILGTVN